MTFILTLHNFAFNCEQYLQIKEFAMGTICAPSYGNIFMDHFDKKYIYPVLQGISLIYLRFIDDIFFIRTGTKEQLENGLNNVNKKQNSIKFEDKISELTSHFLIQKILFEITNLLQKSIGKALTANTSFMWIQNIINP